MHWPGCRHVSGAPHGAGPPPVPAPAPRRCRVHGPGLLHGQAAPAPPAPGLPHGPLALPVGPCPPPRGPTLPYGPPAPAAQPGLPPGHRHPLPWAVPGRLPVPAQHVLSAWRSPAAPRISAFASPVTQAYSPPGGWRLRPVCLMASTDGSNKPPQGRFFPASSPCTAVLEPRSRAMTGCPARNDTPLHKPGPVPRQPVLWASKPSPQCPDCPPPPRLQPCRQRKPARPAACCPAGAGPAGRQAEALPFRAGPQRGCSFRALFVRHKTARPLQNRVLHQHAWARSPRGAIRTRQQSPHMHHRTCTAARALRGPVSMFLAVPQSQLRGAACSCHQILPSRAGLDASRPSSVQTRGFTPSRPRLRCARVQHCGWSPAPGLGGSLDLGGFWAKPAQTPSTCCLNRLLRVWSCSSSSPTDGPFPCFRRTPQLLRNFWWGVVGPALACRGALAAPP